MRAFFSLLLKLRLLSPSSTIVWYFCDRQPEANTLVTTTPFPYTTSPTSHWDTAEEKGTQTVQPIVLVELEEDAEVLLDQTSDLFKWISADPYQAEIDEEDKYVVGALKRYQAWNYMFGHG